MGPPCHAAIAILAKYDARADSVVLERVRAEATLPSVWMIVPTILVLLFGGMALQLVLKVPRAWRGPGDTVPTGLRAPQETAARTFLTFTLMFASFIIGVLLLMLSAGIAAKVSEYPARYVRTIGISLIVMVAPFGLLHLLVRWTNRPQFLVPPRYRTAERGATATASTTARPATLRGKGDLSRYKNPHRRRR